jgi:hypothetical protein
LGSPSALASSIQEQLQRAMGDPSALKMLDEQMGGTMQQVMDMFSQLSPEVLQAQLQQVVQMLSQGDMIDDILAKKEEILGVLASTNMVPPEELAKYRADPEYFEQKMRESFGQMESMLQDKNVLEALGTGIQQTKELLSDPSKMEGMMNEMLGSLMGQFDSDEKIEETRLQVLKGDNPLLQQMMAASPELKDLASDPKKWRKAIKEGSSSLLGSLQDEL